MIARRFAAAGALAFAAMSFPALAQAAPVIPAQAVLAAQEFPFGTTDYKVENSTIRITENEPANTPCERADREASRAIDGAKTSAAEAVRGTTTVWSGVVDRTITASVSAISAACNSERDRKTWERVVAAPADLARYRTHFVAHGKTSMQGWVDVRGATISVEASGKGAATVDTDTFWQVLRAQVAKVERQP